MTHPDERELLTPALERLASLIDYWPVEAPSPMDIESHSFTQIASLIHSCCDRIEEDKLVLNDRFSLISNNISAGIIIEDESGQVVFCSPFFEILSGYSFSEMPTNIGSFWAKLIVAEDNEKLVSARKMSALGEDTKLELRIRHATGMPFWWECHVVPILDNEGAFQGIMWLTYDISNHILFREAIQERNQDLKDFSYIISHDLKAPIVTIKGMALALGEDFQANLGENGLQMLGFISSATEQLERLVQSIITYSNITSSEDKHEKVDLNLVMVDVQRDLAGLIKQYDGTIVILSTLPTVLGDPLQLYQIFSNLIGNALKYSSPDRKPIIELSATVTKATEVVHVKDNGVGIPQDRFELIFRPFQRIHTHLAEGSGIGLACVSKIIKQMGGSVSLQSEIGQGSVFSLTFHSNTERFRKLTQQSWNKPVSQAPNQ